MQHRSALVEDVLRDMSNDLSLAQSPSVLPDHAMIWQDVDEVRMQAPPPLHRPVVIDLRQDTWEQYQYPRVMPLIDRGIADLHFVVPESLTMREVQNRINGWTTTVDLHIVMAIDCYQWIVSRIRLPDSYRIAVEEAQERQVHEGMRGGSPLLVQPAVVVPPDPECRMIFVIHAHDPHKVQALWITRETRAWHLMEYLETLYQEQGNLRLSTILFPMHITARITSLPGNVIVVHFMRLAVQEHCFRLLQHPLARMFALAGSNRFAA